MNGPMQNPMMAQMLTQMFGSPQVANQQFNTFSQQLQANMQQTGMTPQQMVQQKLNSGEISQDDFNRARALANQMLGVNY